MKKVYPAIFEEDEVGYGIYFPDVEGAVTQGDSIQNGLEMASDALGIILVDMLESGEDLPKASKINEVSYEENEQFVTLVSVDLTDYLKDGKLDKKTITIPHWLNMRAKQSGINFSETLTTALENKLNL